MNLYTANSKSHTCLRPKLLPTLSHIDIRLLNRPVSFHEVHRALFDMGPNKAPGLGGLLPTFLQHFWDILHPSIWKLYTTFCFQSGEFPYKLNATLCYFDPPNKQL